MIINTAGEYTLQYVATDACGNSTTVERELTVEAPPTYRTVLYTDGTLIINESDRDEATNIAEHGAATNVYVPFDPNGATNVDKYIFTSSGDAPWDSQASSILSVEIGSSISPTSTAYWFYGLTACTSIDFNNLNTSDVTNMSSMFAFCRALTTLDLSSFDTSNVTDMSSMFANCELLTTLDLSSFNTINVTDMQNMFDCCYALPTLNVSNFDTSNVTTMFKMFYNCDALTTLDLSNFNTNKVTNMSSMFENCNNLTTVDLSSFNTSLVTNMSFMFRYDALMTKIYASANYVVSQVTSDSYMFGNMSTSLVGGAGTVWSSSHRDKTYARIDNPPSAPGYFTAKS